LISSSVATSCSLEAAVATTAVSFAILLLQSVGVATFCRLMPRSETVDRRARGASPTTRTRGNPKPPRRRSSS
jgi:hypothetical protein